MKEDKTYLAVMCRAGTLSMLRTETIWIAKDAQDAATKVDMRPNEDVWVYEFIAGDAKVKPEWAAVQDGRPEQALKTGGRFNQGHPSSLLTYEQFQTMLKGDTRRFIEVSLEHPDYDEYNLDYTEAMSVVDVAQKYPALSEKFFSQEVGCVVEVDKYVIVIRSN